MKLASKVKTMDIAIQSESITIGTLQRVKGREFTEGLVMGWLVYLNDILNLRRPMTDEQIDLCATEVVNEFYNLKFSDLTLLFKRIIHGQYGEYYESLSIAKVLTFFREYFEERLNRAYEINNTKHEQQKEVRGRTPNLELTKKLNSLSNGFEKIKEIKL